MGSGHPRVCSEAHLGARAEGAVERGTFGEGFRRARGEGVPTLTRVLHHPQEERCQRKDHPSGA